MHIAVGQWGSGVEDAWADLGDFVPRLGLAVAVVVVGWLLGVVLAKVAGLVMDRAGTVEAQRGRVLTVAVQVRRAVPRLVRLGVLLVSLWTAVEVIDPGSGASPASDFVAALRGLFGFLGTAAVLTVCAILVVGVGGGLVRPMEQRWEHWIGRLESTEPAYGTATGDATDGVHDGAHDDGQGGADGGARHGETGEAAPGDESTQVMPAVGVRHRE